MKLCLTKLSVILVIDAQCDITHLRYIAAENILRKGEIACNKQFLLFSKLFFYPIMTLIFHFKCTLKFCLQFVSIWTSLKFCSLVMGLKVMSMSSPNEL